MELMFTMQPDCRRIIPEEETDVVLCSDADFLLRFPLEEIPVLKKNSRGVRGMKLGSLDSLVELCFLADGSTVELRGKDVAVSRLKQAHRDGKGTKLKK